MSLLNQAQIAERIPHAGSMVLLTEVLSSSDQELVACAELSHRSPLALNGQLGSETLLEYAGQCMAIHGALTSGNTARLAFISQVKAFEWAAATLPETAATLTVAQQGQTANGAIYKFTAEANDCQLGSGVISIMFSDQPPEAV